VTGPARGDDRGSMPLAMLLTMVGLALTALLTSMVTGEVRQTRSDVQRVQALTAAQAGIDVAMAHILGAQDAAGSLVTAELPCAPIVGTARADGGGAYQASVRYFSVDPHGHDDGWLTDNGSACALGTFPRYAQLTVIGADGAGGTPRTLTATYAFPIAGSPDLRGGLIRLNPGAGLTDLCIGAAQATPIDGTGLLVSACRAGAPEQTFTYQPDLDLAVTTAAHPEGLCIDAGASPSAGDPLALRPCVTPATARQQWRFNGWRNFEGSSGLCLANLSGVLRLGSPDDGQCEGSPDPAWTPDRVQSWAPENAVGVGGAGAAARQLVNDGDYARCLVAPAAYLEETPGATAWPYLKVYPCDQQANPLAVPWHERWRLPVGGPGPIWFTHPTRGDFCLTMPAAGASPPTPTAQPCVAAAVQPASRLWTVRGLTATWADSFRIEDQSGRCLASSTLAISWYANKAVTAPCDSTLIEKWNVLPSAFRPRLRDLSEK
jgi:hypothetical protein